LSESLAKNNVAFREQLFDVLNQQSIDVEFDIRTFYKVDVVKRIKVAN
jgi:hypothetical protein